MSNTNTKDTSDHDDLAAKIANAQDEIRLSMDASVDYVLVDDMKTPTKSNSKTKLTRFLSFQSNKEDDNNSTDSNFPEPFTHVEGFVLNCNAEYLTRLHPAYAHFPRWADYIIPPKSNDENSLLSKIDESLWRRFCNEINESEMVSKRAMVIIKFMFLCWFTFTLYVPWASKEEQEIRTFLPLNSWVIGGSFLALVILYYTLMKSALRATNKCIEKFQRPFADRGVKVDLIEHTVRARGRTYASNYIVFTALSKSTTIDVV